MALRVGLVLLLVLTSVIALVVEVSADPSVAWRGEYYNNTTLTGSPVLVRDDAAISFAWGTGSPGPGVNADQFSVRWTSFAYFSAGDYTFNVTTDDGARLWVDDQLLIDQWHDQSETAYSAAKYLGAGYHSLRLEYYENGQVALIRLNWTSGGPPISEWRGEYFNNASVSGSPVLVRNDSAISFDWAYGSPATGVNADYFSVRWTRDVSFSTSGTYVFSTVNDDGVRVWVDGTLLIDKWYPQSRTTHWGSTYLSAGTHHIKVEYFEQTGVAVCYLSWTTGGTPAPQEVVVDDQDSGFAWGGPTSSWYGRNVGYRGHLYWTWNGTSTVHNWAKWFPYLSSAGNWEVYVYMADRYHGSKSAKYSIYHAGVRSDKVVNQNIYNNQWVSLGTYSFSGGAGEYVYLPDATGEGYATRYIGFDAVKFVKRDGAPPPSPPSPPPPGCTITPILGFGRVWNTYSEVSSKLGCPTAVEQGIWAGEQPFQTGHMFWREDTKKIYVLYSTGTWQIYDDTWTSAEPEWDISIVPPAGYYQPKRGFGKVWRTNPGVRSGLGWATTEERGFHGSVQAYEHGMMLWSNLRGIYVLYDDGTWQRYD